MEKRKLFIYDRKEVGVLILLGSVVSLFAFTLGVHLGKQVVPKPEASGVGHEEVDKNPQAVAAGAATSPDRAVLADEVKNIPEAVEEALDENLRDEVEKTGLQVEKPKPLELPEKTIAEKKAAISAEAAPLEKPNLSRIHRAGKYALQVGSYKTLTEAEPIVKELTEKGLQAEIREVNLRDKGRWYRVFVGSYPSVAEADRAGRSFRSDKRIEDFVVVNTASGISP